MRDKRIVPFKHEHLNDMDIREIDMESIGELNSEKYKAMESEDAFTLYVDDVPIASAGMVLLWNGVAEVWAITGNDLSKNKITFHKIVIAFLKGFIKKHNLHRLQATCFCNNKRSQKWLNSLGFVLEGTFKKYGPNMKDYHIYARVL